MGKLIPFPRPPRSEDVDGAETLAGLVGVHVVVEDLSPDAEAQGLEADVLEDQVEERLRLAGIRVYDRHEVMQVPGLPLLHVQIGLDRHESGFQAYIVRLELCQWVHLSRDPDVETMAATWIASGVWAARDSQPMREVLESIHEGVDRFITAFYAANQNTPVQ